MKIDAIYVEFNAPGGYDMLRLRLWIENVPLSYSVFCRDWIEVIEFLQVANVQNYVSICLRDLGVENNEN